MSSLEFIFNKLSIWYWILESSILEYTEPTYFKRKKLSGTYDHLKSISGNYSPILNSKRKLSLFSIKSINGSYSITCLLICSRKAIIASFFDHKFDYKSLNSSSLLI